MAQACDGYTKTALMGNWYEEREAINQPYRENVDHRYKRETEEGISFVSQNNLLMPLGRYSRVAPWNTSSVIVDDGFRDYKTINQASYDPTLLQNYKAYSDCRPLVKTIEPRKAYPEDHALIQTSHAKNFALLNQNNMQKHLHETKRDVKMSMTNFGSTFKKHEPEHDRFHMMTSYQAHFDRQEKPTPQEVIEKDGKRVTSFKGATHRPEDQKGIKMTSTLTGETFRTQLDPQNNTRVQRSWLPYVEGAIQAAESNLRKNEDINASTGFRNTDKMSNYRANNSQALPYDIATSLPLGEGEQSLKSKYHEPGAFRKIRSDITMIRNNPITKK
jgi:hypothetical protein